jgi:GNAT superfamily N-acetyltransferase
MDYEIVNENNSELRKGVLRLVLQLKTTVSDISAEQISRIVESEGVDLFIARSEGGEIVGMLTLIIYAVPTGIRARIEDVVVDESVRNMGVASELIKRALDTARDNGADGVALTSNPKRIQANRLYKKLGFIPWETNVYFYRFGS